MPRLSPRVILVVSEGKYQDFDFHDYLRNNPDVEFLYANSFSYIPVWAHFVKHGRFEHRKWRFEDTSFQGDIVTENFSRFKDILKKMPSGIIDITRALPRLPLFTVIANSIGPVSYIKINTRPSSGALYLETPPDGTLRIGFDHPVTIKFTELITPVASNNSYRLYNSQELIVQDFTFPENDVPDQSITIPDTLHDIGIIEIRGIAGLGQLQYVNVPIHDMLTASGLIPPPQAPAPAPQK